jgi:hypothetical protein
MFWYKEMEQPNYPKIAGKPYILAAIFILIPTTLLTLREQTSILGEGHCWRT